MSWNGFVKGVNRASTTLLQKAGAVEKTSDHDFEEAERCFRALEKNMGLLHKESKTLLDAYRAVMLAQRRIAEHLVGFNEGNSGVSVIAVGQKYKETMDHMDEQCRTAFDHTYRTTVLDPLTRFASLVPEVNEQIKKRSKKLLDYDAERSKVRRLIEKPSDDPSKLPKAEAACQEAKEIYERLNNPLTNDLPRLVGFRVPLLEPSFIGLIQSQIQLGWDMGALLETLRRLVPEQTRQAMEQVKTRKASAAGPLAPHLDGSVEAALAAIRQLPSVQAALEK